MSKIKGYLRLSKIRGYLDLIRLPNSIMAAIAVLVGALAVNPSAPIVPLTLAAVSAFMISGSSFAINDLCDKELDKSTGHEGRPLVSGSVTDDEAAFIGITLSFGGLYLSIFTDSPLTMGLALCSTIIAYAYSLYLKPYAAVIGHFATSYSVGVTFLYGWSTFGLSSLATFSAVFLMFSVAFIANLSREVVKSVDDYRGDSIWGIRTVAVKRGQAFASTVALVIIVIAIVVSYIPFILGVFLSSYLAVVTLANVLLIFQVYSFFKNPSSEFAHSVKNDMLKAMALAIVAFVIGPRFEFYSVYAMPLEIISLLFFIALFYKYFQKGFGLFSVWRA